LIQEDVVGIGLEFLDLVVRFFLDSFTFISCFFFVITDPFLLEAFLKGWTVGLSIDVEDVHTEGDSDAPK
jgi:hypothetical protein